MSQPVAGARAVVAYEIDDVVLIDSECKVNRDFNPTTIITEARFAHRVNMSNEVLLQTRTLVAEGEPIYLIRYFLNTEAHLLKPDAKPKESPTADDFMASLNFVFAIDYRCTKEDMQDQEAIGAFSKNAQFHVWPFVREEIHAMCGRLRIPRLTIPMLKPIPMGESKGYMIQGAIRQE